MNDNGSSDYRDLSIQDVVWILHQNRSSLVGKDDISEISDVSLIRRRSSMTRQERIEVTSSSSTVVPHVSILVDVDSMYSLHSSDVSLDEGLSCDSPAKSDVSRDGLIFSEDTDSSFNKNVSLACSSNTVTDNESKNKTWRGSYCSDEVSVVFGWQHGWWKLWRFKRTIERSDSLQVGFTTSDEKGKTMEPKDGIRLRSSFGFVTLLIRKIKRTDIQEDESLQ